MPLILRMAAGVVAMFGAQIIAGGATVAMFGSALLPPSAPGSLPWQIAANCVVVAYLTWVAHRSRLSGWRIAFTLAVLLFIIRDFNSVIEALFFGLFSTPQFLVLMFLSFVATAIFAPALLLVAPKDEAMVEPSWQPRLTPFRFALGAFAYLFAYFAAGIVIYPQVRWFYEQRPIPSGLAVISTQLVLRGPIFVLAAWFLIRISRGGRRETVLMVAAALSLLGGVVTLMVPNSLMPDGVRAVHFFEVSISNFLYGALLGWLLLAPRPRPVGGAGLEAR